MTQTGKVVLVDGKWMGEIVRSDACAKCGACQHGQQESRLYPLPAGEYTEGQLIEITLPDGGALSASLIAYGIPIACMLIGLFVGYALGLSDLWQMALALVALVGSHFILKALEPRIRKSGRYEPRIDCPINKNGGQNNGDETFHIK